MSCHADTGGDDDFHALQHYRLGQDVEESGGASVHVGGIQYIEQDELITGQACHRRTGTLWEGRYRSTVIQPERYLIACMVHMDLNPVRDGLAREAGDFPWSSHAHYTGVRNDRFLTPHPLVWALGNTPFAREAAYAERVAAGIGVREQSFLIEATLQGWAAGDADFVAQLQLATSRRVVKQRAGRKPSLPPA